MKRGTPGARVPVFWFEKKGALIHWGHATRNCRYQEAHAAYLAAFLSSTCLACPCASLLMVSTMKNLPQENMSTVWLRARDTPLPYTHGIAIEKKWQTCSRNSRTVQPRRGMQTQANSARGAGAALAEALT